MKIKSLLVAFLLSATSLFSQSLTSVSSSAANGSASGPNTVGLNVIATSVAVSSVSIINSGTVPVTWALFDSGSGTIVNGNITTSVASFPTTAANNSAVGVQGNGPLGPSTLPAGTERVLTTTLTSSAINIPRPRLFFQSTSSGLTTILTFNPPLILTTGLTLTNTVPTGGQLTVQVMSQSSPSAQP
jgi:hypothetical protein